MRRYNVDVAVAAARLGVDEILYDYVRRPDGPLSSMRFPGLRGTAERSIAAFLEESRDALTGTDALLGASVFGIAATRPHTARDAGADEFLLWDASVTYTAAALVPSAVRPALDGTAEPRGKLPGPKRAHGPDQEKRLSLPAVFRLNQVLTAELRKVSDLGAGRV